MAVVSSADLVKRLVVKEFPAGRKDRQAGKTVLGLYLNAESEKHLGSEAKAFPLVESYRAVENANKDEKTSLRIISIDTAIRLHEEIFDAWWNKISWPVLTDAFVVYLSIRSTFGRYQIFDGWNSGYPLTALGTGLFKGEQGALVATGLRSANFDVFTNAGGSFDVLLNPPAFSRISFPEKSGMFHPRDMGLYHDLEESGNIPSFYVERDPGNHAAPVALNRSSEHERIIDVKSGPHFQFGLIVEISPSDFGKFGIKETVERPQFSVICGGD
jgi:hypothetical protein